MTSFIGTIAKESARNWPICRSTGFWGIPRTAQSHRHLPDKGDQLLIWLAGMGFVAECLATGPPRTPSNDDEVPWPGGVASYRQVIPMVVEYETTQPVRLTFQRGLNRETGIQLHMLRSGLTDIQENVAANLLMMLRQRPRGAAPLPKNHVPRTER
jgi:hypothetical protein